MLLVWVLYWISSCMARDPFGRGFDPAQIPQPEVGFPLASNLCRSSQLACQDGQTPLLELEDEDCDL